jgi:hypothetical protein
MLLIGTHEEVQMNDLNKREDDDPKVQMSKAAQDEEPKTQPPDDVEAEISDLPTPYTPQNIIQTSEEAWITGTKVLQGNLIRGLQNYQTGLFQLKEKALLSQKRQEMIKQVTDQYIRFLREEARIASDAALQAHQAVLTKQLIELKASMYGKIADLAGVSTKEIEQIFQEHYSEITDESIRQKYAQFVLEKVFDLLDTTIDQKK